MAGAFFFAAARPRAGPFLQRYKLSAYPSEANLWAPGGGALILQSARPVQFAAGAFDDIVCANNPSVSCTADTSPRREDSIVMVSAINPSVSRSADTSPYTGEALPAAAGR